MIPTDYTRYDCKLGDRTISYEKLCREYRCRRCGSRIREWYDAAHPEQPWRVRCNCARNDFVTERKLAQSRSDALEVADGLPVEFLAMVKGE